MMTPLDTRVVAQYNQMLGDAEFKVKCIRDNFRKYLLDIVSSRFPDVKRESLHFLGTDDGGWDCADSPINVCIYNRDDDPCLDNCLICGDPYERK